MILFVLFCSHSCTGQTFFNRKCKIGLCNKQLYSEFEENEHIRKNHKIGENIPEGTEHKNKITGIQNIHKTIDSLSLVKLISRMQSNNLGSIKNIWAQSFTQSKVNKNQNSYNRFRNIKSPSYNSLMQHNMHQVQQFPCSMCSNKFTSMDSLLKHKIDHEKSIVNCPICLKKFMSNKFLSVHVKDVHVSNRSTLTCELCKENVKNASILHYHLMSHVVSTNGVDVDPSHESDKEGLNETSSAKLSQKQLTKKVKEPNLISQTPNYSLSGSNIKDVCNNTFRPRVAKKQNLNYNENVNKSKELNHLSQSSVFDSNCSNIKDLHSKTLKTSLTKKANFILKQTNQRSKKQNLPKQSVGFDSDCNQKDLHNENLKPRFTKKQNLRQEKEKNTRTKPKLTCLEKIISDQKASELNVDSKIKNQSCIPSEQRSKRNSFYRNKYEILKLLEVKCPVCSQGFSAEVHLQSHILNKHLTRVQYINKCIICHKVEADPKQLSLHMMKHISEKNANMSVEKRVQSQVNPLLLQNESNCFQSHQKKESNRQKTCSTTLPSSTRTSTPAESNLSEFATLQIELKQERGKISLETIEDLDELIIVEPTFKFQCSTCKTGFMTHEELCYHAVSHV